MLAGLDPSDEIEFALRFGKLWSLHLNDQNGLKFDQDKPFGSANLRSAFNQVRTLERHDYGEQRRIRLLRRPSLPHHASRALGRLISSTAAAPSSGSSKKRAATTTPAPTH